MKNKLINKIALLLLICFLVVSLGSVALFSANTGTVSYAETVSKNAQLDVPQLLTIDPNQNVQKDPNDQNQGGQNDPNATNQGGKNDPANSNKKPEKSQEQIQKEQRYAAAACTAISGLNKELPSLYNIFDTVADGGDFNTAAFMDTMVSLINTTLSTIGTAMGNPFFQVAGSAVQLLETIVKMILRGESATSEIAQVEDRLNQQFDDIKLHLAEIEAQVSGLSNQINESTNKIIAAMSTALDDADAKQYLRTFMLGGEGNFSYNQFRNYIYGATTNNSKANTAYFGLLKQHLVNGSSDEIVKYYYDELYTALMDNRDAYYDYLVGDKNGKSIMQYYYDVVSSRPDLVDENGITAEFAAVQFAYDLYYTELMADRLILNCNDYQFVQMSLAGNDYYTLNSGKKVMLADIAGADGIDSMYTQIELREAELLERIAKDLAYILNLDGTYTVEEMSGDVYQLVDVGNGQFGNVLNKQTIYLDSSLDYICPMFGLDRNDYTYTLNSSMKADGVFVVDDHTSTISSSLYYKGEKICGIDFTVDANGKFVGGTGTADDPYLVGSAKQFKLINDGLGDYYQLLRDIDFGGSTISPIGYSESVGKYYEFTGLLNGNGFSVKNLNVSGSTHSGLFGKLGVGGFVLNLKLHNVNVSAEVNKAPKTVSSFYAGIIAGENSGVIQYCDISSDDETKYGVSFVINNETHNRSINVYTGGVAGTNNYFIRYCTVEKCKITAESSHEFGGDSTVQNKNSVYAGGLCGYNYGYLESSVVRKTVSISAKATSCLSPKNTVNPYITAYAGGIAAAFGENVKSDNIEQVYSDVENLESEYELELKDSLWGKYYKNCYKGTDKYVASYTDTNFESDTDDKLDGIKAKTEQDVLNSFSKDERNADGKLYTVEVLDGYKNSYEAGSKEFDASDLKIKVNGKEVEYSVLAVYGFDSKNESMTETMSEKVYMLFFAVIDNTTVILSTGGIDITIGVNKVASIDVLNLKDEYVSGTFSVAGMTLRFNYAVGNPEYVHFSESNKNDVKVSGDIDTFGTSELEFAYNGFKTTYSVNIICGHGSNFTDERSGYIHDDSLSLESTCCEVGYDAYVCATCGDVKLFYNAKTPHIADEENAIGAIPATCYAEGNTGVIKCANCDYVFDEGSVIPKIAHSYVSHNDTLHKCVNEQNHFENHQYIISESVEETIKNGAKSYAVVYTYTCQSCGYVRAITDSNTIVEEEQK
nr:hypothetical protein [Clostridia bacterium]